MKWLVGAIVASVLGFGLWHQVRNPHGHDLDPERVISLLLSPSHSQSQETLRDVKGLSPQHIAHELVSLDSCLGWIRHAFLLILERPPNDKDALRWLVDCGQADQFVLALNLLITEEFQRRFLTLQMSDTQIVTVYVQRMSKFIAGLVEIPKEWQQSASLESLASAALSSYQQLQDDRERLANAALDIMANELASGLWAKARTFVSMTELLYFEVSGVELAKVTSDKIEPRHQQLRETLLLARPALVRGISSAMRVNFFSAIGSVNLSVNCRPPQCLRMRISVTRYPYSLAPAEYEHLCQLLRPLRVTHLDEADRKLWLDRPPCYRLIDEIAHYGREIGLLTGSRPMASPLHGSGEAH